jgi:hypothetical protein
VCVGYGDVVGFPNTEDRFGGNFAWVECAFQDLSFHLRSKSTLGVGIKTLERKERRTTANDAGKCGKFHQRPPDHFGRHVLGDLHGIERPNVLHLWPTLPPTYLLPPSHSDRPST